MNRNEAGRLGNLAARAKDPDHQKKAGKNGFAATVARHWNGDAAGYTAYLRQRAHESQIEALADIQLRAELAKGKTIASVELGPDEDYEPQTWRERVRGSREESSVELPW